MTWRELFDDEDPDELLFLGDDDEPVFYDRYDEESWP